MINLSGCGSQRNAPQKFPFSANGISERGSLQLVLTIVLGKTLFRGGILSVGSCWLLCCFLMVAAGLLAQDNPASQNEPEIEKKAKETIVVTGTFEPVPETELDRSVTVIETKLQDGLYQNWIDYLELDPSIDLRNRAPANVQADLSIRGSTFGQTLVLLDGLRMDDVQTGHHDMDLPLPTEFVRRIEVLRGAGSTLYGSEAMAGSINLITPAPQHSDIHLGAGVGNFGVNQESGSVSLLWRKVDSDVSTERYFSSGFRPDRDFRSLTIFSRTGVQSSLGHSLLMLGYGDKPYGADQFYGPFNSWERTKSWFAGLKQNLGKKTEFDFGFRRHTDEFVLFRNQPSIYENNHIDKSWQAGLRRHDQISRNSTLFYGGEGIHEGIASNNLGDHERSRGAVYVDYDVRALKRFSFSAGAREEIFSATHGEFNPTVAAGVWVKPGLKLKGSASRAFRLPSYTDLYYRDPANLGNINLRPERAWDYEGGLLWTPSARFKAEVTVFERRDRDVIDYVRSSSSSPYMAENIQKLNFTGVETSVELRLPHDQQLQLSYTGLHGVQESLSGLQTKYTFNYPTIDAVVSWYGRLPGKFVARTRIGVVDRYASDPYGLWDAAVSRQFGHVSARLGLANISDTQYEEIPGVIMPGRSVVFGLDFFLRSR
jgi:iron complex outermembrane receptor protein